MAHACDESWGVVPYESAPDLGGSNSGESGVAGNGVRSYGPLSVVPAYVPAAAEKSTPGGRRAMRWTVVGLGYAGCLAVGVVLGISAALSFPGLG